MEFLPEIMLIVGFVVGLVGGLTFPYKVEVRPVAKATLQAAADYKYHSDEHVHTWGSILNDGLGWRCTECNTLRSGLPMPPKPPREVSR